jgi:hypothetical protein
MKKLLALRDWLARWWLVIIGVSALVLLSALFKACHEAGKIQQAIASNPPLPPKQAKAIRARAKADSTKAVVYKRVAVIAIHQADSARHEARQALRQADSLRTQYEAIAPDPSAPFSAVKQRLSAYTSPDTANF